VFDDDMLTKKKKKKKKIKMVRFINNRQPVLLIKNKP